MRRPRMSALSERQKWLIAAALAVAWGIGLFLLADNPEESVLRLCLIPIIIASLLLGFRGLLFTAVVTAINAAWILGSGNAELIAPRSTVTGTILGALVAVVVSTISEMNRKIARLNRELKEQTLVDPLTRLHNRRYAYDVIAELAKNFSIRKGSAEVRKRGQNLDDRVMGLFLLDLDHFKKVNDEHGHAAGDAVLVAVSEVLKANVRFDDIVLRWGGEEFVIVLIDTQPAYLPVFATKIRTAVAGTRVALDGGKTIGVTVSIGFIRFPLSDDQDGFTFEHCLGLSDVALYRAKAGGRDRAVQLVSAGERSYQQVMAEVERGDPDGQLIFKTVE